MNKPNMCSGNLYFYTFCVCMFMINGVPCRGCCADKLIITGLKRPNSPSSVGAGPFSTDLIGRTFDKKDFFKAVLVPDHLTLWNSNYPPPSLRSLTHVFVGLFSLFVSNFPLEQRESESWEKWSTSLSAQVIFNQVSVLGGGVNYKMQHLSI